MKFASSDNYRDCRSSCTTGSGATRLANKFRASTSSFWSPLIIGEAIAVSLAILAGASSAFAGEPDVLLQLHPGAQMQAPLQKTAAVRPPVTTQSSAAVQSSGAPHGSKVFSGGVQSWESTDSLSTIVQSLVDVKAASSPEIQQLDADIAKLRSPSCRIAAATRDSLNHSFDYQATGPSSRAGKIVLDEPLKKLDLSIAEYQRQKIVDKIHSDVVASLLQISLGFGLPDKTERTKTVALGLNALTKLVGESEANKSLHALHEWLKKTASANASKPVNGEQISILEQEALLQAIVKEATSNDAVIQKINKRLNRYAHPGNLKAGTSKVVETALSGVSLLAPGFAIPIASEAVLEGYLQATGGTEQKKLEKELVLAQRIRSRVSVLSREAAMGLESYRLAQLTDNNLLLYFSQGLLSSMTSNEFVTAQLKCGDRQLPEVTVIPLIVETVDEE